jgi:putative oxidoreductase
VLLAVGLATPLAAAGIVGTLTVAIYTHRLAGLWNANGGFELALLYATGALGLGLTGAGRFSLDEVLSVPHADDAMIAAVVLALAVLLSRCVIARARAGRPTQASA